MTSVSGTAKTGSEHISQVYDLLLQSEDLAADRVIPELLFHLNQWSDAQKFPESWQPDPLVGRLPRSLRLFLTPEVLAQTTFDVPEVNQLQEALLLRDLAQWAARRPADEVLETWLRSPDSGLSSDDADNLVLALRLFDWTIRNVQLDELLPYPKDDAAGPSGKPQANEADNIERPAPLRALPGPGYQREPLQTLLVGHGDSIERARIFTLLARQHQIEVVVLAVFDVKVASRPRPWVPAVLAGDRLFLFDTFLGLPLAGPEGQGIATLEQFRKNPELLESLQSDETLRYPLRADDLENLVALVDASPISLTRRMQFLEPALVGRQQLELSFKPSPLADRVRRLGGINSVGILPTSWEAPLYRAALMQMSRVNPQAVQAALAEEALFREVNPISQGRRRHLRGNFESEDQARGAKAFYVNARVPNELLDRFQTDPRAQKQIGLERPTGMSDAAWMNRLRAAEFLYREAKMHATYWLGLIHYDTGEPAAAIEWFKSRTLESTAPTRWKNGARYNLARCYEQTGRWKEARELYLEDTSPQQLGNRLRAQQIRARELGRAE